MTLLGQHVLVRAGAKNASLRKWLATWSKVVQAARWRNITDLRQDYPSADGVTLSSKTVVTVFNVKGNEFRLLTAIDYPQERVIALEVLTHAEYDKGLWKRKY